MDKLKEISEAVRSHSELTITYDGGSQPGTKRRITPISLEGGGLRARCHATGTAKLFSLEKLHLSDSVQPAPAYIRNPSPNKFNSLLEVYSHYRDTLEGMGWHVNTEFSEDYACIALHNKFKNGKVKKGPDLSFAYRKYIDETYFDGDDWVSPSPPRESTRPFAVYGKSVAGGPYGKLDRAISVFMEAATASAPNQ